MLSCSEFCGVHDFVLFVITDPCFQYQKRRHRRIEANDFGNAQGYKQVLELESCDP